MKEQNLRFILVAFSLLTVFIACAPGTKSEPEAVRSHVINPDWSISANIYEVNIRQFTPEGTFNAFREHLPRLKNMGVNILWMMPITPIGELNRKGSLGSYYSVKDYMAINPEFGTFDDFRQLVDEAHSMGMYVIIDWVANHTAWDNKLVHEKPEWFTRDSLGNMVSPFDWSDVVQLNYEVPEVWDYMIDALIFWVKEADVDGFRCDVAFMVPTEFWNRARKELDQVKPVFMLAEAEVPEHHEFAFDMSYGWAMHRVMNEVAAGKKNANHLDSMIRVNQEKFPPEAILMQFTSNHDENSWAATEHTRLGEGLLTFAVLTTTIPGMPLIYNGQEASMNKMLAFFEKDEIDWSEIPYEDFYRELLALKHNVPALWNGIHGGSYTRINTGDDEKLFAFMRQKGKSEVFVILNFSDEVVETILKGDLYVREYKTAFIYESMRFEPNTSITIAPWEYRVYYS
ncbi:MAG: alpha-amylase [Bacteroidales bacterium]|nr:alpha-amylase [Bacteroidales bacterium]